LRSSQALIVTLARVVLREDGGLSFCSDCERSCQKSVPDLRGARLAPLATDLVAVVGKRPIDGIVLDASYYPSNLSIPGIEDTNDAYDALNSALAVNFNIIYAVRSGNKVSSAEKQTPITPLAIAQFHRFQFVCRRPNTRLKTNGFIA
jgi:hypothetical protein